MIFHAEKLIKDIFFQDFLCSPADNATGNDMANLDFLPPQFVVH
jgi:hypothetical protein